MAFISVHYGSSNTISQFLWACGSRRKQIHDLKWYISWLQSSKSCRSTSSRRQHWYMLYEHSRLIDKMRRQLLQCCEIESTYKACQDAKCIEKLLLIVKQYIINGFHGSYTRSQILHRYFNLRHTALVQVFLTQWHSFITGGRQGDHWTRIPRAWARSLEWPAKSWPINPQPGMVAHAKQDWERHMSWCLQCTNRGQRYSELKYIMSI